MAIGDVLAVVRADKPEKKAADKKYVTFTGEEWREMEKVYGKTIEPADVKAIITGIFTNVFNVSVAKKSA